MDALQASKVIEKTLSGAGAPLTEDQALLLVGALAVCIEKVRAAAQPAPAPSVEPTPLTNPELMAGFLAASFDGVYSAFKAGARFVEQRRATPQPAPAAVPADEVAMLQDVLRKVVQVLVVRGHIPRHGEPVWEHVARAVDAVPAGYVRHYALRALIAWDGTVLPKAHDGMMQERMEDLRTALDAAAPASATGGEHE